MTIEEQLSGWAKPPSKTERERCDNAMSVVKAALDNSSALDDRNILIFPQGSYRNKTNVRQDSDVDICVLCTDTFYYDLPNDKNKEEFGITPASYHEDAYRKDIQDALISQFGAGNVSIGNKAFNISENTYRVTADVVACFEHREFLNNGDYRQGTAVLPKSGPYICNYPDQSYENGRAKNDNTGRRFRSCVRILKNLNNHLTEQDTAFKGLPSFLIESLVWNVSNEGFGHDTLLADIWWILAHLCDDTRTDDTCDKWCEVNGVKYLFHILQAWNRVEANSALNTYWRYFEFD